jgi:hypothetical protein
MLYVCYFVEINRLEECEKGIKNQAEEINGLNTKLKKTETENEILKNSLV